jgi:hypothetical protein
MPKSTAVAGLALALLAAPVVLAAEPAQVTSITAKQQADGKVQLDVIYEGSACEQAGEAAVESATEDTVSVTIPATKTAEVCTMQIVPVEFSGIIPVEPATTTIAVTVLNSDGQSIAVGSASLEAVDAQ